LAIFDFLRTAFIAFVASLSISGITWVIGCKYFNANGEYRASRGEEEMKLNVKAFALTCGLIWAFGLLCLTWWIIGLDGVTREPTLIGRLYRGYNISPLGSLIGMVWAFFDALIGGAIFA